MKIEYIYILLIIQSFFAGIYCNEEVPFSVGSSEMIYKIAKMIGILFFGFLIIPAFIIIAMIAIGKRTIDFFCLGFMAKYIWLKQPLMGFTLEKHEAMKIKVDAMPKHWYNISNLCFIYCFNWVTKNYAQNKLREV